MYYFRLPILFLIRVYQKTISLDHGIFSKIIPYGACKFRPTCSEYGYEAIEKYGLIRGSLLAAKRILRCHPWSRGGYDPVTKTTRTLEHKNKITGKNF